MKNPFKSLSFQIASRYLWGKKSERYINFSIFSAAIGIALVIMVFIVVSSVERGFEKKLIEQTSKILKGLGDKGENASLFSLNKLSSTQISQIPNFLKHEGLINSEKEIYISPSTLGFAGNLNATPQQGTTFYSIPKSDAMYTSISCVEPGILNLHVTQGTPPTNSPKIPFSVWIGGNVSKKLKIKAGQSMLIALNEIQMSPMGPQPIMKRVVVAGILDTNIRRDVYLARGDCLKFLNKADGFDGMIEDAVFFQPQKPLTPSELVVVRNKMETSIKQAFHLTNESMMDNWHLDEFEGTQKIIQTQRWVGSIVMFFILFMGSHEMISGFLLLVREKRQDIAVLRSMGFSRQKILAIFLIQGVLVGVIGLVVGVLLGLLVSFHLNFILVHLATLFGRTDLVDSAKELPSIVDLPQVFIAFGIGCLVSVATAFYPAWQASQTPPVLAFQEGGNP